MLVVLDDQNPQSSLQSSCRRRCSTVRNQPEPLLNDS
jgi:hypothetical protein